MNPIPGVAAFFFGEAFAAARPPRLLFFTGDAVSASAAAGEATTFLALDLAALALALAGVAFLGDGDFALAAFPPRLEVLRCSNAIVG